MPPSPTLPTCAEIDRMIAYAVRAPSVLNTQPWRFVVGRGYVVLCADPSRQLAALDPHGREMTMSCAAALCYLRVAARHAGWEPEVDPLPDAAAPDLLAAVTFRPGPRPDGDDRLFRALTLRRTSRRPFTDEPVPPCVAAELAGAASAEGASLRAFTDPVEKEALAQWVAAGILAQGRDPALVADLQAWLRPAGDPRPDGVLDSAQGMWDRHASLQTPVSGVAEYKSRQIQQAPAVLVLSTEGDGPADWLAAGQALAHVLIVAADRGLAASYANEPVQVDALRPEVAALAGGGVPQVVLRLGYPKAERPPARRYARDVTEHID